MSMVLIKQKKGFTLIEILLVIAAIGILAAIVIISINPTRQLAQARNIDRRSDINTIYSAVEQYNIENNGYPSGITATPQSICPSGGSCVDLGVLIPDYLPSIPTDPTGTPYTIRVNPDNNRISVSAPESELGQVLAVNPRILPWAEGGDNVYTISASGTNYRVHEFTTPGSTNILFTRGGNVEYLIVGGGGGSGTRPSPPTVYPYPGGGGQVVTGSTLVSAQSYAAVVGSGGLARGGGVVGDNGLASSIFSISANPGLGGGSSGTNSGNSGSGFIGGARSGCGTGGGAGAGGNGGNAIPTCGNNGTGGIGGIGVQSSITGTNLGYGGGGGGVSWNQGCGNAFDGGGMCGVGINHAPISGISPSRGGGGGSWQNGGNGVVIVRYEVEL